MIYLDPSGIFIREECISGGSTKRLHLQSRRLLQRAFDLGAAALILVHNHPSRNPIASEEDVETTKRLATVAAALEIELLDHLIVGGQRIYSVREGVIL